jgi:hypothetical protein
MQQPPFIFESELFSRAILKSNCTKNDVPGSAIQTFFLSLKATKNGSAI